VYRGVILFNLTGLRGKVKWAKLSYQKNDGTPEGERHIMVLKLPWVGTSEDMWSASGYEVNRTDAEQMRAVVQGWVDDAPSNHGFLMWGADPPTCSTHRMRFTDFKLEIGIDTIQ
jgi:hypothetical protein